MMLTRIFLSRLAALQVRLHQPWWLQAFAGPLTLVAHRSGHSKRLKHQVIQPQSARPQLTSTLIGVLLAGSSLTWTVTTTMTPMATMAMVTATATTTPHPISMVLQTLPLSLLMTTRSSRPWLMLTTGYVSFLVLNCFLTRFSGYHFQVP